MSFLIQTPKVQWVQIKGQKVLVSKDYSDVYFSHSGGSQESEHVFINGNRLIERWAEPATRKFKIYELGFGSAINFLSTLNVWIQSTRFQAGGELFYSACEIAPFSKSQLEMTLSNFPELLDIFSLALKEYPENPTAGAFKFHCPHYKVHLELFFMDVQHAKDFFSDESSLLVDAWFLDGFSPGKNPALWATDLFRAMVQASHPRTTFSTYSVAKSVKDALKEAGFFVQKVKGYAKKREMLSGGLKPNQHLGKWLEVTARKVTIIGAGLAGTAVAFELCKLGFECEIYERHSDLALEASGNPKGLLLPSLTAHDCDVSEFSAKAYQLGLEHLQELALNGGGEIDFSAKGIVKLYQDGDPRHVLSQRQLQAVGAKAWEPHEVREFAGIDFKGHALFFPQTGSFSPKKVCEERLRVCGNRARVIFNTAISSLDWNGKSWALRGADQKTIAEAPLVVLACSQSITSFEQTAWLPFRSIRGQLQFLKTKDHAWRFAKMPISFGGYYIPDGTGGVLGASFVPGDVDLNYRTSESIELFERWSEFLPEKMELPAQEEGNGRVGIRSTFTDHFPVVGGVPEVKAGSPSLTHYPQLLVLGGLGAKGLSYGVLGAKILGEMLMRHEVLEPQFSYWTRASRLMPSN